jgi:hypothetical protein
MPLIDFRGRLGHVIVTAPDHHQLMSRLAMIRQCVTVRGEPT